VKGERAGWKTKTGLECGHLTLGTLSAETALPQSSNAPRFSLRLIGRCAALALALWVPAVAHAQPAAPDKSYLKVTEPLGGDFALRGYPQSQLREILFREKTYRPLNAVEFIHVKALGPKQDGQPILMAVSNDFMGVGTILIAVQNGTPLARVLSPTVDIRDPDMGLAQPGRQNLLLFTAGSRALVTSTGQVLWFEHARPKEYVHGTPLLVSVSPDNRTGALLLDNEIRLSRAGAGAYASVPFTKRMQSDAFKTLWDESSQAAKQALDAGQRIDQRRLYANLKAAWINRNFTWHECQDGWRLQGRGLTSAPLPALSSTTSRQEQ